MALGLMTVSVSSFIVVSSKHYISQNHYNTPVTYTVENGTVYLRICFKNILYQNKKKKKDS